MCSFPLYLANLFEGLTERESFSFTVSQMHERIHRIWTNYSNIV